MHSTMKKVTKHCITVTDAKYTLVHVKALPSKYTMQIYPHKTQAGFPSAKHCDYSILRMEFLVR